MVHRVEAHELHHGVRQDLHGVEDGREVRPRENEHAVKMRDIAEKHRDRREQNAKPDGEEERVENGDREQKQRRVERRAGDEHHDNHCNERKAEIHKPREDVREREEVFWDIDLLDERGIGYDRVERGRRGFRIEREDERARKIVDREIRDVLPEERGKDDRDNDHHQQRVEHRPHKPQRGMAVAHLDIAHHKLAQQRHEPAEAFHFFFDVSFAECHDPVFLTFSYCSSAVPTAAASASASDRAERTP